MGTWILRQAQNRWPQYATLRGKRGLVGLKQLVPILREIKICEHLYDSCYPSWIWFHPDTIDPLYGAGRDKSVWPLSADRQVCLPRLFGCGYSCSIFSLLLIVFCLEGFDLIYLVPPELLFSVRLPRVSLSYILTQTPVVINQMSHILQGFRYAMHT